MPRNGSKCRWEISKSWWQLGRIPPSAVIQNLRVRERLNLSQSPANLYCGERAGSKWCFTCLLLPGTFNSCDAESAAGCRFDVSVDSSACWCCWECSVLIFPCRLLLWPSRRLESGGGSPGGRRASRAKTSPVHFPVPSGFAAADPPSSAGASAVASRMPRKSHGPMRTGSSFPNLCVGRPTARRTSSTGRSAALKPRELQAARGAIRVNQPPRSQGIQTQHGCNRELFGSVLDLAPSWHPAVWSLCRTPWAARELIGSGSSIRGPLPGHRPFPRLWSLRRVISCPACQWPCATPLGKSPFRHRDGTGPVAVRPEFAPQPRSVLHSTWSVWAAGES